MTRKVRAVDLLSEYFATKGRVLSRTEYVKENDGPLSLPAIKRSCGSWSRMIRICDNSHPDRMAIARGAKPEVEPEAPKQEPEKVPTRNAAITSAAEALQKLKENDE